MKSRCVATVESRAIGSEIILLDTHGGKYFSLNETGKTVWELLGLGLADQSIAAQVAETYGVAVDVAKTDCGEVISALIASGLAIADA